LNNVIAAGVTNFNSLTEILSFVTEVIEFQQGNNIVDFNSLTEILSFVTSSSNSWVFIGGKLNFNSLTEILSFVTKGLKPAKSSSPTSFQFSNWDFKFCNSAI